METTKNIYNKSVEFIKGKYLAIIILVLLPYAVSIVGELIMSAIKLIGYEALNFLAIFVMLGINIILSNVTRIMPYAFIKECKQGIRLSVWAVFKRYWRKWSVVFNLSIVGFLIILAGSMLLIIPGIFASILFGFALVNVVAKDMKAIDALAYSWELISGRKWQFVKLGIAGFFKIFWLYLLLFIPSGVFWLYMLAPSMYLDMPMPYILFGVINFLVLAIIGYRSLALYKVFIYHLFEEFERTITITDSAKIEKLKNKIIAYAWGSILVIIVGLGLFLGLMSRLDTTKMSSSIMIDPQYIEAGDLKFAIPKSWTPQATPQDGSYGFSIMSSIDQVVYQYVIVNVTKKAEPMTFEDIRSYFTSQESDLESLKADGVIIDYTQNVAELVTYGPDRVSLKVPYIRTSTTLFDETNSMDVVETSVIFERDDFLYEVQSMCVLEYTKMCITNIEAVLNNTELK